MNFSPFDSHLYSEKMSLKIVRTTMMSAQCRIIKLGFPHDPQSGSNKSGQRPHEIRSRLGIRTTHHVLVT